MWLFQLSSCEYCIFGLNGWDTSIKNYIYYKNDAVFAELVLYVVMFLWEFVKHFTVVCHSKTKKNILSAINVLHGFLGRQIIIEFKIQI